MKSNRTSPAIRQVSSIYGMAIVGLCIVCVSGCERKRPSKEEMLSNLSPELRNAFEPMQDTPFISRGKVNPEIVSSDSVSLEPEDEVIGVIIKGQPIAYPLKHFIGTANHIVNAHFKMLVGYKFPYTVTYCDITECVRVLQLDPNTPVERTSADSLGLSSQGLLQGELAIVWNDEAYKQRDEIPGLRDIPHQRTTWLLWRADHPETLVYTGENGN